MRYLLIDNAHYEANAKKFAEAKLQPRKILKAQRKVWDDIGLIGGKQNTAENNFLILGRPFEHEGAIYSTILNDEIRGSLAEYIPPTIGKVNYQDTATNVVQNMGGVPLAWKHDGGESDVLEWYRTTEGMAVTARLLFNVHHPTGWTSLFHEPVHESTPSGGIGTGPLWIYEGYCEIFAEKIAQKLGEPYNKMTTYGNYVSEVQKMIDFVGEKAFAKAYFLNDEASYGLMAPIFYQSVVGHAIFPAVDLRFLPSFRGDVPPIIRDLLTPLLNKRRPEWYKRWVALYGRSDAMQVVPQPELNKVLGIVPKPGGLGGGPARLGGPGGGPGGGPKPLAQAGQALAPVVPGNATGKIPPDGWPQ